MRFVQVPGGVTLSNTGNTYPTTSCGPRPARLAAFRYPRLMASTPLLACVPNFSAGRDPAVIKRISEVVHSVEGVRLLDVHMAESHNRSVLTFVGPPR